MAHRKPKMPSVAEREKRIGRLYEEGSKSKRYKKTLRGSISAKKGKKYSSARREAEQSEYGFTRGAVIKKKRKTKKKRGK